MRWSYAWRAWCTAAALAACGAVPAVAEDTGGDALAIDAATHPAASMQPLDALASAQPSFDPLIGGTQAGQFLFYAGVDAWRYGASAYGGIQWAPGRLENEGFFLRLIASDGLERYETGSTRSTTQIFRASLTPGWKFKRGSFEAQLFAGPAVEVDMPSPDLPGARMRGTYYGARGGADFWWEPTPQLMLASSFSATTIANAYSARGAMGWRIVDGFWLGPEISASGDNFSQQYRIGAHITGFKTADVEWSAAAGYVQDSFNRSGVYGRLGLLLRR
jgi:hypothetical protein